MSYLQMWNDLKRQGLFKKNKQLLSNSGKQYYDCAKLKGLEFRSETTVEM